MLEVRTQEVDLQKSTYERFSPAEAEHGTSRFLRCEEKPSNLGRFRRLSSIECTRKNTWTKSRKHPVPQRTLYDEKSVYDLYTIVLVCTSILIVCFPIFHHSNIFVESIT